MPKKIILTGDRTTGPLHIGHYFGSLINRKRYENEYQTFIMAADVQALTDNYDNPEKVSSNVLETVTDNLALGLNLEETTIFIQSQIPQIAELTVFFSNLVSLNRLRRNPTVKTEISQKKDMFGEDGESVNFGFVGYPVSQTADITIVKADLVPVGIDQLPVIEVCREIVEKFNRIYSPVFPVPEAQLSEAPKILGLDGNSKMSKSLNNAIYLKDTEEETTAKIKTAKTDSGSTLVYDPENRPEISNLVLLYSLVNSIDLELAQADLVNINYGAFKQKLAADLNSYFREFRERRLEISNNSQLIVETLAVGRARVLVEAEKTMNLVRSAMKIDYKF